jgi:hypothetical protein
VRLLVRLFRVFLVIGCFIFVFLVMMGWGLRQVAVGQIVELTGARVETKSVDVDLNGSVSIKGLVVRGHKEQPYDAAILKADKVRAKFGLGGLLLLRPMLTEIHVEDFVLDAQCDLETGSWNTESFRIRFPPGSIERAPAIRLEKGLLQYSKVVDDKVKTIAAVPVEADFHPDRNHKGAYSFKINTAKIPGGYVKSELTGLWQPGRVSFAGGLSSADVAALEKVWTVRMLVGELTYDPNDDFRLKLKVADLLSRYRREGSRLSWAGGDVQTKWGLFADLQRFFNRYCPAGLIDIELDGWGNFANAGETKLRGFVQCKDVSLCDRKFQYPIEHISGRLDFTEEKVLVNNLCGEHGAAKTTFSGWSQGYGPDRQYELVIESEKLALA